MTEHYELPETEPKFYSLGIDNELYKCTGCKCHGVNCIENVLGCYCVRAVKRRMIDEGEGVFTPKQLLVEYTVFLTGRWTFGF